MSKIVSLLVHKNTREQRRRKAVSLDFVSEARTMAREKAIDGYAIVAWNRHGDEKTVWSWNDAVPRERLRGFVDAAIAKQMTKFDTED